MTEPNPIASPSDLARRAAEIVQERGHCKGGLWDADGRVCLWGALREAADELTAWRFTHNGEFVAQLKTMFPGESTAFPGSHFNDKADTDELDVAKVLLQLADRLDVSA